MPETILQRVAAGEAAAVDECMAAYSRLVWSLARRFSAHLTDAEDAVQEIFIDVWRYAGRYQPAMGSEATYISTIARRRLTDRYRKSSRRPAPGPLLAEMDVASSDGSDRSEIAEEADAVRARMAELRPEERQVLELAIDRGLSQSEIAQTTNLPLGTVKTHARRGLMRLRRLLADGVAEQGEGELR